MTAAPPAVGARASRVQEKLSDDVELTAVYAFAGALTPFERSGRPAP